MGLETAVLDIIDGKKKNGFFSSIFRACSLVYGTAVALRHLAYKVRLCKVHKAATFVVSVGNIACGGTGKTPFVQFLAKSLSHRFKVAILSRGYRSLSEHLSQPILVSGENGPVTSAAVCGDEPYLLASSLPGVAVWVGKHRNKAAHSASMLGADIIILDDGMQYRKLARDIEIVILDGHDILAGGKLLPAGRLRDFPYRLRFVDLIVVNHAQNGIPLSAYQEQLRALTKAPVITVQMSLSPSGVNAIQGRSVGVFCALGRPDRFIEKMRHFPCQIVDTLLAPDHASISAESLTKFALQCQEKGADMLVCSAKDAVKLSAGFSFPLPLVIMDAEMEILDGHNTWNALLDRIKEKRK